MTQPKAPSSTCKDCLSQHGEHLEGCIATYTHQTDDAPSSDTNKVSIQDVVNGTPAGQKAVQRAVEASIKDQDAMSAKAQAIRSDTNELDQESEQALLLEEAYNLGYQKVRNGCLQEVLEKLNLLIATKEQQAYKAGMVKDATHRLTDAVDRMRRLDKDALKEFLKELKGDA